MEEASENGKESPHSVHANGLIGLIDASLWSVWTLLHCLIFLNILPAPFYIPM